MLGIEKLPRNNRERCIKLIEPKTGWALFSAELHLGTLILCSFLCWLQSIVHSLTHLCLLRRAHTHTHIRTQAQRSNEIYKEEKVERREIKRERVYKTIVKDVVFAFHVYASQWNLFMWFFSSFHPSIPCTWLCRWCCTMQKTRWALEFSWNWEENEIIGLVAMSD